MKEKWGTERDYRFVVDTTAVQTKLKILIRDDVFAGRTQAETNAKALKIIRQYSSKILALQSRKEFETSLAQSFLRWYSKFAALYEALQRFSAINQNLVENVNSMLPPGERFEGITFDESVRNVVTDNARGSPYIAEYQKEVKKEFSNLLKDLAKEDAKTPSGGSLRNVAEVKVRWQANERDLKNMLKAGVRLVWSSSHVDASIRCTPWQGRLYSLDGTSGIEDGIPYEPLENAMLGTKKDGNGLLGYNCRHRLIPYQKDNEPPRDYTEEEMKHARYVDQTQRRLEREIRAKKTEAYLNRGIDSKKSKELFAEARDLSDKYRKFSEDNGTTAFMYRTQVMREEVDYKKTLLLPDKSDIINNEWKRDEIGQIIPTEIMASVPKQTGQSPNAVIDRIGRKGEVTRYFYNNRGERVLELHTTDHGNPKLHPPRHIHVVHIENGFMVRSIQMKVPEDIRIQNANILKGEDT